MSRRKQSRPVKLLDEDVVGPVPPSEDAPASAVQQPSHGKCCINLIPVSASRQISVDSTSKHTISSHHRLLKNIIRPRCPHKEQPAKSGK